MKNSVIKPFIDFFLVLAFLTTSGYFAYHYWLDHKEPQPQTELELQADAEGIDLKEMIRLCRQTLPATNIQSVIPQSLSNQWEYITIHHSATLSGNAKIFSKNHNHNGMENGLAYHFVINNGHGAADGMVEVGNRWHKQLSGGHIKGDDLNAKAIGICLVGDFNRVSPTKAQIASLKALLVQLMPITNISKSRVLPHKKMPGQATACPGLLPIKECLKNLQTHN